MAYTLADNSANQSRLVRGIGNAVYPVVIDRTVIPTANTSQSTPTTIWINAGDALYWTGSGAASLNTAGTNKANSAAFIGIAETGYPWRLREGVYENEPDPTNFPPEVSYATGGQFRMRTTAADVYTPGANVYLGVDAQTVTVVSTNNGTLLGTVASDQRVLPGHLPLGSTITGVAGGLGTPGAEVIITIKPAITL